MKPVLNNVAKQLKEESSPNIIAFVDATKEDKLGQRFKVKGYPTVKFFKDGKFGWDYNERDEAKILDFMRK
jgi:protein disulfide isomerase family A protein 5